MTMLHRKSGFMIICLLKEHNQMAVIEAINDICDKLGIELFQKLFQVILADRGTEFGNPYAIECDRNGEIKTKLFYCDPYCSWQKGMLERNHEFIRQVLSKGKSFNDLSQSDIHLLMNHINNYPRESLNNVSPYELAKLLLGDEFLKALSAVKIERDDFVDLVGEVYFPGRTHVSLHAVRERIEGSGDDLLHRHSHGIGGIQDCEAIECAPES